MSYDFMDNLSKILREQDDEENMDFDPRGDQDTTDLDYNDTDVGAAIDWTGIPDPKPGRTLADMKAERIKGPPMIVRDGKEVPADPNIDMDVEEGFTRRYKLPMGRITQNVYDKLPEELQAQYKKVEGEEDYTKVPRGSIEKEFIGYGSGEKWYWDDVVSALKSTIISHARGNSTPNFSVDEGVVAGIKGVMDAWMTDLGKSPFHNHAFSSIRAAVRDGAARASNISGKAISKGGTRQPFSASKDTVSADAPVDDSDSGGTFASSISGDAVSGKEEEKRQVANRDLILAMVNEPGVNLTDNEKLVMLATYGINRKGEWIEPKSTKEISDALGVSNVRVSQMRKKAVDKIKEYVEQKNISPESALRKFGVSQESKALLGAMLVLESIKDIVTIEIDMLDQYQDIPIVMEMNGAKRLATARVNTDTMVVEDIMSDGDSVLYLADKRVIGEAKRGAKARTSSRFFAEMASTIIGIHSKPILGVINTAINDQRNTDDPVDSEDTAEGE